MAVRRIVFLLAVCGIAFFLLINWNNITIESTVDWFEEQFTQNSGDGYPVTVNSSKSARLEVMGGSVVLVNSVGINVYNKNGGLTLNEQHGFSFPAVSVSGDRSILYDAGGTSYKIQGKSKTYHTSQLTKKIITADMSGSGVYAIVTDSSDRLSEMTVYDEQNTQIFKCSTEQNISAAAVNGKGNEAAVSTVTTVDGEVKSTLVTYRFDREEPVAKVELEKTLVLKVFYFENGNIGVIGDNAFLTVSSGKIAERHDYPSKYIMSYGIDRKSGAALVLSGNENKRDPVLSLFNDDGKKLSDTDLSDDFRSVFFTNEKACVMTSKELLIYNAKGERTNNTEIPADGIDVTVIGNDAFVLGLNQLRKIQLS